MVVCTNIAGLWKYKPGYVCMVYDIYNCLEISKLLINLIFAIGRNTTVYETVPDHTEICSIDQNICAV